MNFGQFPLNDGLTKQRREFLQATLGGGLTMLTSASVVSGEKKRRPKVAAIFTSFRYRSHAHVILENFLEPYLFNGRRIEPLVEVVSFYADQFPEHDMARETAKSYGIPIYPSIADALTLGGKKLAVDAALSIAEHGKYPVNEFGQIEYPHKRFYDSISKVVFPSSSFSVVIDFVLELLK